jgi:hypothetical protein
MMMSSLTSAAGVHHLLGRQAQRRAGLDRGAQHVTGGNLRNAIALADEGGLRAFAGARRAQEDQSHRVPRICGLLRGASQASRLVSNRE